MKQEPKLKSYNFPDCDMTVEAIDHPSALRELLEKLKVIEKPIKETIEKIKELEKHFEDPEPVEENPKDVEEKPIEDSKNKQEKKTEVKDA